MNRKYYPGDVVRIIGKNGMSHHTPAALNEVGSLHEVMHQRGVGMAGDVVLGQYPHHSVSISRVELATSCNFHDQVFKVETDNIATLERGSWFKVQSDFNGSAQDCVLIKSYKDGTHYGNAQWIREMLDAGDIKKPRDPSKFKPYGAPVAPDFGPVPEQLYDEETGKVILGIKGQCYLYDDLEYTIPVDGGFLSCTVGTTEWEFIKYKHEVKNTYQAEENVYCYDYPAVPPALAAEFGLAIFQKVYDETA